MVVLKRVPSRAYTARAILDPISLNELFPNLKELGGQLNQLVTGYSEDDRDRRKPHAQHVPLACFHNHGNGIVSLGAVVRWLAGREPMPDHLLPVLRLAAEVLYKRRRLGRYGPRAPGRWQGWRFHRELSSAWHELHAKYNHLRRGLRGHLAQAIANYKLISAERPAELRHRHVGFWRSICAPHAGPEWRNTTGYRSKKTPTAALHVPPRENNQTGLVVGLTMKNPWLSPFGGVPARKTHLNIRWWFSRERPAPAGQRISCRRAGDHRRRPARCPRRRSGGAG